ISGLATDPASPASGGNVVVHWNDLNAGSLATSGSYYDKVVVQNTSTGETLATASVVADAGREGVLPAGGSRAPQFSCHMPDGPRGVGGIAITVTADTRNDVTEYNAAGTAETNNTASLATTSALGAYPDLQVSGLSFSPTSGLQSGQQVTVTWGDN